MYLTELTVFELRQLIVDAKESSVLPDLLRNVISTEFRKPVENVTLTDVVAFGWEVAQELVNRLAQGGLEDAYFDREKI